MFRRDEGDGNPHDVVLEKLLAAGEMFRCRAIRENGKWVLNFLGQWIFSATAGMIAIGFPEGFGSKGSGTQGSGRLWKVPEEGVAGCVSFAGFWTSRCHSQ